MSERFKAIDEEVLSAWDQFQQANETTRAPLAQVLHDILSVYSDELQRRGDPRGQLIAVDLEQRRRRISDDVRSRLVTEWLGASMVSSPDVATRYGLVSIKVSDETITLLEELLRCAGDYVECVRVFATPAGMRLITTMLTETRRPWLGRLDLALRDTESEIESWPILDDCIAAKLIDALPSLHSLRLSGRGMLDSLSHPRIRNLEVDGFDACFSLCREGPPFPSVQAIDFAFQVPGDPSDIPESTLASVLSPCVLPALHTLDLSRNEPGSSAAHSLGGTVRIHRFVRHLALTQRLNRIYLPSIRSAADAEDLKMLLVAAPNLQELSVSKNFGPSLDYQHARAVLRIPAPLPWPPIDQCVSFDITVSLQGDVSKPAPLGDIVATLDRMFHELPQDARDCWNSFFEGVKRLISEGGRFLISRGALDRALDACSEMLYSDQWREIASHVRRTEIDAVVISLQFSPPRPPAV